jgi:hypothetical protein
MGCIVAIPTEIVLIEMAKKKPIKKNLERSLLKETTGYYNNSKTILNFLKSNLSKKTKITLI